MQQTCSVQPAGRAASCSKHAMANTSSSQRRPYLPIHNLFDTRPTSSTTSSLDDLLRLRLGLSCAKAELASSGDTSPAWPALRLATHSLAARDQPCVFGLQLILAAQPALGLFAVGLPPRDRPRAQPPGTRPRSLPSSHPSLPCHRGQRQRCWRGNNEGAAAGNDEDAAAGNNEDAAARAAVAGAATRAAAVATARAARAVR